MPEQSFEEKIASVNPKESHDYIGTPGFFCAVCNKSEGFYLHKKDEDVVPITTTAPLTETDDDNTI
jgi:hypothetical protein